MLEKLATLNHWQIDLAAIGFLLQGAVLAVFPEEVIMLTLGFLWRRHQIGFLEAFLAIQIGLLPANAFAVAIGRTLGGRIFHLRPFSWVFKRGATERAISLVKRHGSRIIFFTRFIPSVRAPIYAAVGISGIRVLEFVQIDALASCIHIPTLLLCGGILGTSIF